MSPYVGAFLLLLISIMFFTATIMGAAYDRKSGYTIAAFFLIYALLFALAAFLDSDLLMILLVPVPIGIFMTLFGFSMIASCFFYTHKIEGIYMDYVFSHVGIHRRRKYYKLIFKYQINRHTVQMQSNDSYLLDTIQKHYEPRSSYPIWVNPKKPQEFRVKRFSSLYSGIMATLFGLSALIFPVQMLLDTLKALF